MLDVIKNRRSIRRFGPEEVPEDKINKLKEALIWAPSAGNLQARKFYFVFSEEKKEALAEAALDQHFVSQAPLVVVGCGNENIEDHYGERGISIYNPCDVSMSLQNLLLIAQEEALGAVVVGGFNEQRVSQILDLPDYLNPILMVPIGFPAEEPETPERVSEKKAIEEIR